MTDDCLPRDLGDGLVQRVAQTAEDLERIAELHGQVFGASAAACTGALSHRYPGVRPQDFSLVEDTSTGEVVSSLNLVPTTWLYEGLEISVAELGIVATDPDYRRQGLIRRQMVWFERRLQERFDLGSIQGIPCFYRRFGFEYCVPLEGGYELRREQVPDALETEDRWTVRHAGAEDIPQLLTFLAAANGELEVASARSEAVWRYQDDPERTDVDALDSYLVLDGNGRPVGHFRLYRHESQDRPGAHIVEASPLPHRACLAALRLAKEVAAGRRCAQTIRVHLPAATPLARLAAYLGGRALLPYAWQVRVPDPVRFLKRIAPALEARLARSFLAGYNTFLRIDLYEDTLELLFREGRLADVRSLGPLESQAVRLPWWAAWQLWLGYHSREELSAWYPDARVSPALQPLMDVLFPKRESWVFPTI